VVLPPTNPKKISNFSCYGTIFNGRTLKHGACGYVLKRTADAELLSAMHTVLRGEFYVHPSMTRVLLEDMLPVTHSGNEEDSWKSLSEREQEVLKMVAFGYTSAEIADQLSLSAKTVETYRARGMEKLGLRTRTALVKFALQERFIKWD
jgi:two-component system response regulator NreC